MMNFGALKGPKMPKAFSPSKVTNKLPKIKSMVGDVSKDKDSVMKSIKKSILKKSIKKSMGVK